MLSIELIRQNPDFVKEKLRARGQPNTDALVDQVLVLDKERRALQRKYEALRQQIKEKGEEMTALKRSKEDPNKEASLLSELAKLKKKEQPTEKKIKEKTNEYRLAMRELPNVPLAEPEVGKMDASPPDTSAKIAEIRKRIEKEKTLPHWDWLTQAAWVDFEQGAKVTGSGFVFFKGKGARLVRALINFFLDSAIAAGYTEVNPPLLVNEAAAFGTGQLPDKEGQMYSLKDDPYFLIPTGEVPITNLYRDRVLAEKDLPIRLVGYTPCFRREAGTWGAKTRGLNRLHQFDKVEIVQITVPKKDVKDLEETILEMVALISIQLIKLDLPHRGARLEPKDLGFASAHTGDFEVFAGYQERWLEVSSLSFFGSFQALRHMKLRYKSQEGKVYYANTFNGSALALPRVIAALVENNQYEGGRKLRLPAVLKDYLGKDFGLDLGEEGIEVEANIKKAK